MAYTEILDNWASMQENSEQLKRYIAIGKANALVEDMEKEVEKYTKLLELAKQDQVYVVTHNVNNFHYAYEGKLAIGEMTEHYHNIIKTSYDIEEIKSTFKEMTKGNRK